jgi:hypothetical protein
MYVPYHYVGVVVVNLEDLGPAKLSHQFALP